MKNLILFIVAMSLVACSSSLLTKAEAVLGGDCTSAVTNLNTDLGIAQAAGVPIVAALNGSDAAIAQAVLTDAADAVNLIQGACAAGETALVAAKLPVAQAKVATAKTMTKAATPAKAASIARAAKS